MPSCTAEVPVRPRRCSKWLVLGLLQTNCPLFRHGNLSGTQGPSYVSGGPVDIQEVTAYM